MKKDITFDNRADKYDKGLEGLFSKRFYYNLINAVELKDGLSVLDVGCGTGSILKKLSIKNCINGYGTDISENMLIQARKKCPEFQFQISDCSALPFKNNTIDIIVTCMAYHHFHSQEQFRIESLRILKNNGKLYLCDPLFPSPVRNILNSIFKIKNTDAHFYHPEEIKKDFVEIGFKFEKIIKDKYVQVLIFNK